MDSVRGVRRVEARIWLTGGTSEETGALAEWLTSEEQLRGCVHAESAAIGETELGSPTELLTVILGTGGAGTALASSLKTWLLTRKTKAKITVEYGDHSVTLDIESVDEVTPLLTEILKSPNDK
jgi:hypothetical protein